MSSTLYYRGTDGDLYGFFDRIAWEMTLDDVQEMATGRTQTLGHCSEDNVHG